MTDPEKEGASAHSPGFITQPPIAVRAHVTPTRAVATAVKQTEEGADESSLLIVDESIPCPLWRTWQDNPAFVKNRGTKRIHFSQQEQSANATGNEPVQDVLEQARRLGLRDGRKVRQQKNGVLGELKLRAASGLTQPGSPPPKNKQEKQKNAFDCRAKREKEILSLAESAKVMRAFVKPTTGKKKRRRPKTKEELERNTHRKRKKQSTPL